MASSSSFVPTSKKAPCPICGNTSGHCKTKTGIRGDTLIHCHNHGDNPGHEIAGYEWIKRDAGGWGVFVPAKPKPIVYTPSRHQAFKQFLANKKLEAIDRKDLTDRGLSDEEIKAFGAVTVGGSNTGYTCICLNPAGEIVGSQWRTRKGDPRYRWINWIDGGAKNDGELPLTCRWPINGEATGIAVVEGIGPKSFILAQRSQQVVIGAGAAVQFSSSPRHWTSYLTELSAKLNTTTLRFYPDAGAVANAQVMREYRKWFKFVASLGYQVRVAWWEQVSKHAADVDELDSLDAISFISVSEFEAIAQEHGTGDADLIARIDSLLKSNKPYSRVLADASALAAEYQYRGSVTDLLSTRSGELERAELAKGLKQQLAKLEKNRKFGVEVERLFPGPEGQKFCQWLRWKAATLGVTPMALVWTWFPAMGSVLQQGNKVWLGGDHFAPPIVWNGIVGRVGGGKTPGQAAALRPLSLLDAESMAAYQAAVASFEQDYKDWRRAGKDPDRDPGDEPEMPADPRQYIVRDFTMESLAEIQVNQPENGVLIAVDELAGLFLGLNQYKGGKGNDRQKLLSIYGGEAIDIKRKGQKRIYCPSSSVSVTGTIQPSVIAKLMGDCADEDGLWSRFNFLISDGERPHTPTKKRPPNYDDWLKGIYRRASEFAPKQYDLDDAAFDLYTQYWDKLTDRIEDADRDVHAGLYSKARDKVGRVALILHLFNAALERTNPAAEINYNTVSGAIDVMLLSIQQSVQLLRTGDEVAGDSDAICHAIWRYLSRRKSKSATWLEIARGVSALRPNPNSKSKVRLNSKASVIGFLRILEDQGCIERRDDGTFAALSLEPEVQGNLTPHEAPATDAPIPDFDPAASPAEPEAPTPQPEPEPDPEPEEIGIGDRVIVVAGPHDGAVAEVIEIVDGYFRCYKPANHPLPEFNEFALISDCIKYSIAAHAQYRANKRFGSPPLD